MVNKEQTTKFRCVLHGSFRKHYNELKSVYDLFIKNDIEVLAPKLEDKIYNIKDGFAFLNSQELIDPRLIELEYLHNLKRLSENGFSYFINKDGYIGKSVSYELGIAQISNTRCFFVEKLKDHSAYIHKNSIYSPEDLVKYIKENNSLPKPKIKPNEKIIHKLWEQLMVPGSIVAVGGIIEYQSQDPKKEKEILLVKTHKWNNKYSMVGGKVRRKERLKDALAREIKEETGLNSEIGNHICTFDQVKNSGYYLEGIQHIFVDKIVRVRSKKVYLNDEAENYIWLPAKIALDELSIEPNARYTLEQYCRSFK